jgi:hypothetical protein
MQDLLLSFRDRKEFEVYSLFGIFMIFNLVFGSSDLGYSKTEMNFISKLQKSIGSTTITETCKNNNDEQKKIWLLVLCGLHIIQFLIS